VGRCHKKQKQNKHNCFSFKKQHKTKFMYAAKTKTNFENIFCFGMNGDHLTDADCVGGKSASESPLNGGIIVTASSIAEPFR